MTLCPHEIWADVLRIWGKDIWELSGGEAAMLAERIFDNSPVDPGTGGEDTPAQRVGSVARFWREYGEDHPEELIAAQEANTPLLSMTEISKLDDDFDWAEV
jgi:hypothetical protein